MRVLFIFSLLFSVHSGLMAQDKYSMADLEILAQEKGYTEYFAHALDIRPSERNERWKEMTILMAENWAKTIKQKAEPTIEDYQQIEKLFLWPTLKNNEFFRPLRFRFGISYLQNCFRAESWNKCWPLLKNFWEADPTDPDTALQMVELVQKFRPQEEIFDYWPWLKVALNSPLSEFYCQKEVINDLLWEKIRIEWIKVNKDGSLHKKLQSMVHQDCMKGLTKYAAQKLSPLSSALDREQAFAILKGEKKLSALQTELFYIYFLMDNPSQGETFNYAWNHLQELGKSSPKRDQLLSKIKSESTLPDETMNSLDEGKRRIVLKEIHKQFPELLQYYGKSCLGYVSGSQTFEQGNPTLYCKQIIESGLAPELFGPELTGQIKRHLKF